MSLGRPLSPGLKMTRHSQEETLKRLIAAGYIYGGQFNCPGTAWWLFSRRLPNFTGA